MEDRYEAKRKKMKERPAETVNAGGKRAERDFSSARRNRMPNPKHFDITVEI
jgi:hypothetical protein